MTENIMNDIETDKDLHDAFGKKGTQSTPSSFKHPEESQIIKRAYDLLSEIPAGKELIPLIKDYDIKIEAVVGREPNVLTFGDNRISLVCPKVTHNINDHEMACNLAIGIKEIELNNTGNQMVTGNIEIFNTRTVAVVMIMCRVVSEFFNAHNHTKLVDLMGKLGYSDVYGLYRSRASYEVMKEKILTVISERK
jgi:hypothetical protein